MFGRSKAGSSRTSRSRAATSSASDVSGVPSHPRDVAHSRNFQAAFERMNLGSRSPRAPSVRQHALPPIPEGSRVGSTTSSRRSTTSERSKPKSLFSRLTRMSKAPSMAPIPEHRSTHGSDLQMVSYKKPSSSKVEGSHYSSRHSSHHSSHRSTTSRLPSSFARTIATGESATVAGSQVSRNSARSGRSHLSQASQQAPASRVSQSSRQSRASESRSLAASRAPSAVSRASTSRSGRQMVPYAAPRSSASERGGRSGGWDCETWEYEEVSGSTMGGGRMGRAWGPSMMGHEMVGMHRARGAEMMRRHQDLGGDLCDDCRTDGVSWGGGTGVGIAVNNSGGYGGGYGGLGNRRLRVRVDLETGDCFY